MPRTIKQILTDGPQSKAERDRARQYIRRCCRRFRKTKLQEKVNQQSGWRTMPVSAIEERVTRPIVRNGGIRELL